MKKCSKCSKREGKLVEKPLSQFFKDKQKSSGYYASCKDCCKTKFVKWYDKDESKELCKIARKSWNERNKEKKINNDRKYRKDNREKLNKYFRDKRKNDEIYKTLHNLRIRHNDYISGRRKSIGTRELLGCPPEVFLIWLDFCYPKVNYDRNTLTHDHVVPCNWYANQGWTKENEKECFHWSNYRYCTSKENTIKKDKIDIELIEQHREHALIFIDFCKSVDILISVPNWKGNFSVAERN